MARNVSTQLMFEGDAEAAMTLYVSLFNDSAILQVERYAAGEHGPEGSVKRAQFKIVDQTFWCIDSPVKHNFTFTPSFSIFVECNDEAEQETAYRRLSEDGIVHMPLDNYGFSKRFGWVCDRYGVSWQLNVSE